MDMSIEREEFCVKNVYENLLLEDEVRGENSLFSACIIFPKDDRLLKNVKFIENPDIFLSSILLY